MFKISELILEKMEKIIQTQNPTPVLVSASCFSDCNGCANSCKGTCHGGCGNGCGRSAADCR